MSQTQQFQKYLAGESEPARLTAIDNLLADELRTERDLLVWKILSSFPTKFELVRLAISTKISSVADGSWALASFLLQEADQDVVGNAINSLTFSNNRALGHRTMRFFKTSERPQRILYCLARYAEEAIDRRFSQVLPQFMESELSDAFLARSFNALFRLGVKDTMALKVAMDLVSSHIDATNMDRKAAVAAIVYLCFAGNQDDIEQLKSVQNKVTIPELRRLLNWGLYELNGFEQQEFSAEAAKNFLKRANNLAEPNFTGFGCFSLDALKKGAKQFLKEMDPEAYCSATRTLLALGHGSLIDILAKDKRIGLAALEEQNLGELKRLWKHYLPTHSKEFMKHLNNPELFDVWHDRDCEALCVTLDRSHFSAKNGGPSEWQKLIERLISEKPDRALELLSAQLLIVEREPRTEADPLEALVLQNIKSLLKVSQEKSELLEKIAAVVYGTTCCGDFKDDFVKEIYSLVPFPRMSWAFNAFSLRSPHVPADLANKIFTRELRLIETALNEASIDPHDFQTWVTAQYQGFLHATSRLDVDSRVDFLKQAEDLSNTLQAVFDVVEANVVEKPPKPEKSAEDWGQAILDKPVQRWNSVLQVWASHDLTPEAEARHEKNLRDALRVAPHVEKRWIVCALVKLGTDDAIKAILYQAIQHVDSEFVGHTIRQLLHSNHPRAQQALIRCVGRNTISDDLKLTILDELSLENPQEILQELKTLEILRLPAHIDDAIRDAVGRVSELVEVTDNHKGTSRSKVSNLASVDVDAIIKGFLSEPESLSVDSRSALRTAEMILVQSKDWGEEAVDLSPIVNMHCKAVELTLRETFEAYTDAVIRRGELSRKLDILGYARPIPEKMQIFEDYLAQLPVIHTIPYFSKFKLRKMLRAICLYRPGKRFTLDGPKAFALLFLVGSRTECPFGLAGTIPLGFQSDQGLFEFIKLVHSLQDSRNRAVHEGLTWDAKDEIESLRSQAYTIIDHCTQLAKDLKKRQSAGADGFAVVGA